MPKSRGRTARDVLNELRWREGKDLKRTEIWYADRVKPEGYRVMSGGDIAELGRGYFSTADSMFPYYKILRIVYEGVIIFERPEDWRKTPK